MPNQTPADAWNVEPSTDPPQNRAVQLLLGFTAWWNKNEAPLDLVIGGFQVALSLWLFLNWTHEPMRMTVEAITGLGGGFMLVRQFLRAVRLKGVINQ